MVSLCPPMSPTVSLPSSMRDGSPHDVADVPLNLPHIPLTFDNTDADASALRLIYALCPEWESEEGAVEFIRFTDGITNTLTKAIKRRPGRTKSQIDQEAILLRAYGQGTGLIIDRDRELKAHNLLARLGLAPPLLAKFDNGLMYRFVEGEVCSPADLRRPEIYRQVAKRLGQWHGSLPVSALTYNPQTNGDSDGLSCIKSSSQEARPYPNVWVVMEKWVQTLPADTEEQRKRKRILTDELAEVSERLGDTAGLLGKNFVFGHCDLLSGNVIVAPQREQDGASKGDAVVERAVDFIDYEYATPSPAAFDLANHFAEWGGFECDYGALPTRSQRRDFIQHYVPSFHLHAVSSEKRSQGNVDVEKDVDQLFEQVELFRGIPGLFWGIWSLIQATISQIDFDYASYAEVRLGEYWAWKAEMDGSRVREGHELTLRERRWAQE